MKAYNYSEIITIMKALRAMAQRGVCYNCGP